MVTEKLARELYERFWHDNSLFDWITDAISDLKNQKILAIIKKPFSSPIIVEQLQEEVKGNLLADFEFVFHKRTDNIKTWLKKSDKNKERFIEIVRMTEGNLDYAKFLAQESKKGSGGQENDWKPILVIKLKNILSKNGFSKHGDAGKNYERVSMLLCALSNEKTIKKLPSDFHTYPEFVKIIEKLHLNPERVKDICTAPNKKVKKDYNAIVASINT